MGLNVNIFRQICPTLVDNVVTMFPPSTSQDTVFSHAADTGLCHQSIIVSIKCQCQLLTRDHALIITIASSSQITGGYSDSNCNINFFGIFHKILEDITKMAKIFSSFFHILSIKFLAALEVQMLVCLCVCVSHLYYKCTKDLNFKVFRLKDF